MPAFTNTDAIRLLSEDGTSCTIPDTFTSIADRAFYNWNTDFDLLHTVIIPSTITSIGYGAFAFCSSISSITIPPSVVQIRGRAFFNCSSLKSVIISDAALNNNYYGMDDGEYYDPFFGCTELIAKAQQLNMTVKEYLLHRNERIRMVNLRYTVLNSLKTINNARILARSEGGEFIWVNPIWISNRRRWLEEVLAATTNKGTITNKKWKKRTRRKIRDEKYKGLNGVLAEERIPPFEMWREIVMFF